MIWVLAAPIVVLGVKSYVSSSISEAINNGSFMAKNQTIREIYKIFISSFLTITINLILLIIAVYGFPYFLEMNTSILIIASVYISSILHGLIKLKKQLPIIKKIATKYKFNIKNYIKDQIYEEAYYEASSKIRNLGFIARKVNNLFGESAHSIARKISESAIERVFREAGKAFMHLTIMLITYYLISRLVVTPFLINNSTSLSTIDLLLYPFIFSFEYFLGYFIK